MPRSDDDNIENRHSKRKRDHSDDETRKAKDQRRHHHDRERRSSRDRSPPSRDHQRRERSRSRDGERSRSGDGERRAAEQRRHVRGEDRRPERDREHFRKREQPNNEHRRNPNDERNQQRGGKPRPVWGKEAEEAAFVSKKDKPLLDKDGKPIEKEKPNFEKSGKLTEHTNTFNGVVVKYNEPKEARMPKKKQWRLYPYKGEESLKVLHLHRQSAFLFGRDRRVADIPLDHPSISQQHAVLQYRAMPYTRPDGVKTRAVYPYIIDLESSNGTFLNNDKIEPRRYVELKEGDMLKFGFSTREYVLLCETSTEAILMENEDFED